MSKTYLPIHSDQPEERFVVEKLEPKQFGRSDHWNTESEAEHNEAYEAHLKYQGSAAKYPFPALTREMPDKLVEGVDFKLGMQRFIDGLDKWVDCGKIEYDSISWQLHQSHRRIIAVPISVKSGEEKPIEDWQIALRRMRKEDMFDDKFDTKTLEFVYAFQMGFKTATPAKADEEVERILCAAIWYKELDKLSDKWIPEIEGFIRPKNIDKGIVICGYRHPSCMYTMIAITGQRSVEPECGEYIQGFLTSKNRFVDREEGGNIFQANGGKLKYSTKELYSEDLY